MKKPNGLPRLQAGFIDPISIVSIGFLVLGLLVTTAIVNNPNIKLDLRNFASGNTTDYNSCSDVPEDDCTTIKGCSIKSESKSEIVPCETADCTNNVTGCAIKNTLIKAGLCECTLEPSTAKTKDACKDSATLGTCTWKDPVYSSTCQGNKTITTTVKICDGTICSYKDKPCCNGGFPTGTCKPGLYCGNVDGGTCIVQSSPKPATTPSPSPSPNPSDCGGNSQPCCGQPWPKGTCNAGFFCSPLDEGTCKQNVCHAEKKCTGNVLQVCKENDSGWNNTTCPNGCDPVNLKCKGCKYNINEPFKCSGKFTLACDANGEWDSFDCGKKGCNPSTGQCYMCIPNTKECSDNILRTCDDSGTSLIDIKCPAGCDQEKQSCITLSCGEKNTTKCINNTLSTCNYYNWSITKTCLNGCYDETKCYQENYILGKSYCTDKGNTSKTAVKGWDDDIVLSYPTTHCFRGCNESTGLCKTPNIPYGGQCTPNSITCDVVNPTILLTCDANGYISKRTPCATCDSTTNPPSCSTTADSCIGSCTDYNKRILCTLSNRVIDCQPGICASKGILKVCDYSSPSPSPSPSPNASPTSYGNECIPYDIVCNHDRTILYSCDAYGYLTTTPCVCNPFTLPPSCFTLPKDSCSGTCSDNVIDCNFSNKVIDCRPGTCTTKGLTKVCAYPDSSPSPTPIPSPSPYSSPNPTPIPSPSPSPFYKKQLTVCYGSCSGSSLNCFLKTPIDCSPGICATKGLKKYCKYP